MPARLQPTNQVLALLYHARAATPFRSQDGEPCASIPAGIDSRNVVALRSAAFRDWLTANYYAEFESAPSFDALRSALRTLEARACHGESPAQKVAHRLSFEGDPFTPSKIILDLANSSGEVVEITSQGWNITGNLRYSFRQSAATLPLPHPCQPPDGGASPVDEFARIFRLAPIARARALAWLSTALRPIGPYPILVVSGPSASGKSLFIRALRALIDPSAAPVHRLPARDGELLRMAHHNWMLVFDHVHRVAPRISDALCAISSGDAIEITQTDYRDPLVFEIARPIVLIAPSDETQSTWTPPRALGNRTVTIQLGPLAAPRPEAALWSAFETIRPALVATLADAAASALQRIRDIDLGNVARFPDCAAWAAAAAPALGLDQEAIVDALAGPSAIWAGSDPFRDAVYAFLAHDPHWSGDASALLDRLRVIAPRAALPATPKGLLQALDKIPEIRVIRTKGAQGQRTLAITRVGGASQSTAPPGALTF
jgi:hypothetical protein